MKLNGCLYIKRYQIKSYILCTWVSSSAKRTLQVFTKKLVTEKMYKGTSSHRQPRRFDSNDSFNDQQQTVTMSELFNGVVSSPRLKPQYHRHHVSFNTTDSIIGERNDRAPVRAFEQHEPDSRRTEFRVYAQNVDEEADEFIKFEHKKFLASKTLPSSNG